MSTAPLSHRRRALSPVDWLSGEPTPAVEGDGIGLCLSGGGYRAMLFHVGALWRLNELGYLRRLTLVSSVSGGSITAGVLGMRWAELDWDAAGTATNFEALVADPIRDLAGKTIDVPAGLLGLFTPWSINRWLRSTYDRRLFHRTRVSELTGPTFVINSTDLRTGELWRFSEDGSAADGAGSTPLAAAVAASSAFPPILGPAQFPTATLVDGGVYDNLGLQPAWTSCRTVLVSDAGGAFKDEEGSLFGLRWRWRDWGTQSMRVLKTIDHQVRELRKHQVIVGFEEPEKSPEYRRGAYWGIRSEVESFPLADPLDYAPADEALRPGALAETPTRLAALERAVQDGLIDWGYVICDTAMRSHVVEREPPPAALPRG
jgi:NTE family protein